MAHSQLLLLAALLLWGSSAVTTCPGSCTCPSPSSLNCSSVGLTQVPQHISDSVTELDLSDNLLGSVTINRRHHNLRNVWLGNNSITHLSLCVEKNLRGRYVTGRHLHHLGPWHRRGCVSWAPTLQLLSAERNQLEQLPEGLQSCKSLQVLQLSFNRISVLRSGDLSHLRELKELHLKQNLITSVHPQTFKGLDQLQVLDLSFNMLTTLHPAMFLSLHNTGGDIRLAGNRWRCDCRMRTLRNWMAHDTSLDTWSVVCDSPSKLLGKDLRHLKEDDLNCFTAENKLEPQQDVKGFHGSEMLLSCYKQADSMRWIPSGEVSVNQPEAGLLIKDVNEKDRELYVCLSEDGEVVSVFNPQFSKVGGAPRKTRSIPDSNSQIVPPGTHVRIGNERNLRANTCQLALAVCLSILFTFIVAFILGVLARPCIDVLLAKCCKKKRSTAINTVSTVEQRQYDNMAYCDVEENGVVGTHRERRVTFSTIDSREDNNVQYYDTVAADDQESITDDVFKGEEARARDRAGDSGSERSSMVEGVTRNSERKHSSSSSASSLSAKEYNGGQMQDQTRPRSPQMVVDSVQKTATIQATREVNISIEGSHKIQGFSSEPVASWSPHMNQWQETEDQFEFSDSVGSISPRSSSVLGSFNDSKLVTKRKDDSSSSSSSSSSGSHLSDNEITQYTVNADQKGGVINTGFHQGASFEQQINTVDANRPTFVTHQGHPGVGRTHSFSSTSSDSEGEGDKAKQVKEKGVGRGGSKVVTGELVVREKVIPMPRAKRSAPLPPASRSSSSSSESDAEHTSQQPKTATIGVRETVIPMPRTKRPAPLPPAAHSSSSSSDSDVEDTFQQPQTATIAVETQRPSLNLDHTATTKHQTSSSSSDSGTERSSHQQEVISRVPVKIPPSKTPLQGSDSSSSSDSDDESSKHIRTHEQQMDSARFPIKESLIVPQSQWPVLDLQHTSGIKRRLDFKAKSVGSDSSSSSSDSERESSGRKKEIARVPVTISQPLSHVQVSDSSSSSDSDDESSKHIQKHEKQMDSARFPIKESLIVPQSQWPVLDLKQSTRLKRRLDFKAKSVGSDPSSSSDSERESSGHKKEIARVPVTISQPLSHVQESDSSSSSDSDDESSKHIQKHEQQMDSARFPIKESLIVPQSQWPVLDLQHTSSIKRRLDFKAKSVDSDSSSSSDSERESSGRKKEIARVPVTISQPLSHVQASDSSSSSDSDDESSKHIQKHEQQMDSARFPIKESLIVPQSQWPVLDLQHTSSLKRRLDFKAKSVDSDSSSSSDSERESSGRKKEIARVPVTISQPLSHVQASDSSSSSDSDDESSKHIQKHEQMALARFPIKESLIVPQSQWPVLDLKLCTRLKRRLDFKGKSVDSDSSSSSDSERESSGRKKEIARVPVTISQPLSHVQVSDSSSSSDSDDESSKHIQKHEKQMDSARFPIKESLIVPQSQWPVLDLQHTSSIKRRLDFKAKSVDSDSSSSSDSERESSGRKKEIARVPVTISQPLSHVQASDSSSSSDSDDESSKHIQKHEQMALARFPIKESLIVPQSQWPVLDLKLCTRLKRRLDFKVKFIDINSSPCRDSDNEIENNIKKQDHQEKVPEIGGPDSQTYWPLLDLQYTSSIKRRLDIKVRSSLSSDESDGEIRDSDVEIENKLTYVGVTSHQQGTTLPDLNTRVPLFKPHLNARAPSESEESSSSSSDDENRRERDHLKLGLGATSMSKTSERGFIESPKSPVIKVPLSPKTDYNIKLERYEIYTDNLVEKTTNENISTTPEISPELESRWASMSLGVSRFRKRLKITSRAQDPPKVPSSPLSDSPSSSSSESGDESESDRSTLGNFNETLHITRETSSSSNSETDVIDSSVPDLSRGVPRIKRRLNVRAPVPERRSSHSSISDTEVTKYTVNESRKVTSVPQYRDTDTLITYKRSIFQATSPPSSPPPFNEQSTYEIKRFSEKGPSYSVENRSTSVASKKSHSRSFDDLLNKMVGQKRTTELPPEIRWTGIGRQMPNLPTTSPRSHLDVGLSSAPAKPSHSPSHSSSSSSSSSSESDNDIKLDRGKSNAETTQKYSFSAGIVPSPYISEDKRERRGLSALRSMSSARQQWDVRDNNLENRSLIQFDSYKQDSETNYHYQRSEEHVLSQSTDLVTDSLYGVPSYRRHGVVIDKSLEQAPPPIPATPPPSDEMLGLAWRSRPNSWKERSEGTRNYWRMSLNTGDSEPSSLTSQNLEVPLDPSKDPITNV